MSRELAQKSRYLFWPLVLPTLEAGEDQVNVAASKIRRQKPNIWTKSRSLINHSIFFQLPAYVAKITLCGVP